MTQFLQRRLAITAPALAALAFLTLPAAHAAGYPDHPVTVVVPYPPGGGADIFGRAIAHALEPGLKQTVLVENKPGAGGNIGMAYVARAKPDGYTLGLGTIGTQTINQFLYNNMAFDPERDLVPIALVSTTPNVIAVSAKSPYKTVADVIKAAQQSKDKKLTYASPGIGSSVHLTGAYFEAMAGVTMLHVPFKGTSASLPAVAGGQVDLLFDNLPGALAQIKDGNLVRGVAVTSAARDASVPNLPTVAESGLPGFDVTAWFALYAPRNTPEPVVRQLIEAARSGLKNPAVAANFAGMGAKPGTLFGADLAAFEAAERKKWGGLIKDKGITAQ
ncbi:MULTISPECIES: tripartite tricarboxylate transporter substrate binding protein [Achromobacter]|uniref:Tripartite tricarboxylate transporter substrate binding protein n=1 Tax=Alcaligenes xylosoxydans xylosoxydans TaxID=85698 RepID=A0A424W3T4_ALCXX|nr:MULTISPECIES: tripartite tricarboxylate transporter substrate binding protein [Achromobacter]MBC9908717.1 tripartite tricarboxylate transporter substrate binding protein [Achromobacter xylosoxidans]MBD0872772.1 tripartite tricarboxylate transporter substrate binding protein [Achromobacter xylosoxidans]MDH1299785.1 tripartite tricarboxylate transporter substrate binding protein [Achromobacter sp. GD03932]QNP83705.1 tripartite tricarboxylate transporter substrate binding protein [Achromobacter